MAKSIIATKLYIELSTVAAIEWREPAMPAVRFLLLCIQSNIWIGIRRRASKHCAHNLYIFHLIKLWKCTHNSQLNILYLLCSTSFSALFVDVSCNVYHSTNYYYHFFSIRATHTHRAHTRPTIMDMISEGDTALWLQYFWEPASAKSIINEWNGRGRQRERERGAESEWEI